MDFSRSAVAEDYLRRLSEFMNQEVMPAEAQYKQQLNGGADWRQWRQPATAQGCILRRPRCRMRQAQSRPQRCGTGAGQRQYP